MSRPSQDPMASPARVRPWEAEVPPRPDLAEPRPPRQSRVRCAVCGGWESCAVDCAYYSPVKP